SMIRAAAFASGTAVALDTNGTVRDARGFASRTYSASSLSAYWTLSSPRTPTPRAIADVYRRISVRCAAPSVIGGSAHAEAPEWGRPAESPAPADATRPAGRLSGGVLGVEDLEHVLERERLEVQPVGRVVVGRHGFRVAVHHDRLVAGAPQGHDRVHARVVEL